jgi:hypothetical protein
MKTIDITPTWESLVLTMAQLYVEGTSFESRKVAEEELLRMGRIADAYVYIKKQEKATAE